MLVMRYEDILKQRETVVQELAALGLPWNSLPFFAIEHLASRCQYQTRKQIVLRESVDLGVSLELRQSIRDRLVAGDNEYLLKALGYSLLAVPRPADVSLARSRASQDQPAAGRPSSRPHPAKPRTNAFTIADDGDEPPPGQWYASSEEV